MNSKTKIQLLLAERNGVADTAIRDVIESLDDVDLAWDVHDSSEVLDLIEKTHPDVALLSHNLMHTHILTVLSAMVDKSSRTKILVISMHNDSRFALRMIEAGASGYVLANRIYEELGNAMKIILSGRIYLSSGIAGLDREDRSNDKDLDDLLHARSDKSGVPKEAANEIPQNDAVSEKEI